MFQKHHKDVQFFVVYIKEAHAIDSTRPTGGKDHPIVQEPINWKERSKLAQQCTAALKLDHIPTLIDEVDDVRVSNPPANGELLNELGRRFTGYKYDFKRLVRDICTSRTYQLATQTNQSNESDTRNFSHASLRRIRSEILLDCITQVTNTSNKFRGLPKGARAVQIADGSTTNYFLQAFGRAKRETVCSCEVQMEPNLSQALHLINGDTVEQKIRQGGLIKARLDEKKTSDEIIEELYLRCFSRRPVEKELASLKSIQASAPNQKEFLDDLFWSLLNSREFLFNH